MRNRCGKLSTKPHSKRLSSYERRVCHFFGVVLSLYRQSTKRDKCFGCPTNNNKKERCTVAESVIVEIRAAEGGADARDLVNVQFGIYAKMGVRRCL
jgi:hypothetical protein